MKSNIKRPFFEYIIVGIIVFIVIVMIFFTVIDVLNQSDYNPPPVVYSHPAVVCDDLSDMEQYLDEKLPYKIKSFTWYIDHDNEKKIIVEILQVASSDKADILIDCINDYLLANPLSPFNDEYQLELIMHNTNNGVYTASNSSEDKTVMLLS